MTEVFDVAVVGAGPAGAAAALWAARAGLSVALFEPQTRPDKPCGEGVPAAGVAALRALGLADVLACGCALTSIRYVLASGRVLDIPFREPGIALERPVLGAALQRALEREERITFVPRHVSSTRDGRRFRLESGRESWLARVLIGADGLRGDAASWLRRSRPASRRHGLRARAAARRPLACVEVHLGRASEVYLTPLAHDRINVAVLRSTPLSGARTSAASLAAALREHPRAAATLGEWVTAPEARALARARPRRTAEQGAFLAGDAAGGIDPVLGCGVALALTTGIEAARAAERFLAHGAGDAERDYRRFVRRETRLRGVVANTLMLLGAHPRLQDALALGLAASPRIAQRLASRVAGRDPRGPGAPEP